jgi:hypothetical protein
MNDMVLMWSPGRKSCQELESRLASVAGFREQQGSIAREMQYLRSERDSAKQEVAELVRAPSMGKAAVQSHAAGWIAAPSGLLISRPPVVVALQSKEHAAAMQQLQATLQQEHKQDTALLVAQHAASLEADLDARAAKVDSVAFERTYRCLPKPAPSCGLSSWEVCAVAEPRPCCPPSQVHQENQCLRAELVVHTEVRTPYVVKQGSILSHSCSF